MSTREARVHSVPPVQTSAVLEVLESSKQQYSTRKCYESLYVLPEHYQHSKYSSGPSSNIFCKRMGMELSDRCTNGRIMLHTRSIQRIFRVLRVLAVPTDEMRPVRAVPAVQNPEILGRVMGYPQYRSPKYCVSRCIEPRNTASTCSIPRYISPKYSCVPYSAVHYYTPSTRSI